jgi:hypothetical protein
MKVTFRTRLNGRLPDPQGKYRDEITQEATVEIDLNEVYPTFDDMIQVAEARMDILKSKFYKELARLGGCSYEV